MSGYEPQGEGCYGCKSLARRIEETERELAEARELLGEALSSLEDLYHGGGSDDCHDCELYRRIDAFLERKP